MIFCISQATTFHLVPPCTEPGHLCLTETVVSERHPGLQTPEEETVSRWLQAVHPKRGLGWRYGPWYTGGIRSTLYAKVIKMTSLKELANAVIVVLLAQ